METIMDFTPGARTTPIHPDVKIGHVHLKVANLDRALAFYHGVLGFEVTQGYGQDAVFISAGGYHHHIGLNTWESKDGLPPAPGTTGLYHPGDSLSDACRTGRRIAPAHQRENPADRCSRSWRERSTLSERSRWQRSGTVLGSAA